MVLIFGFILLSQPLQDFSTTNAFYFILNSNTTVTSGTFNSHKIMVIPLNNSNSHTRIEYLRLSMNKIFLHLKINQIIFILFFPPINTSSIIFVLSYLIFQSNAKSSSTQAISTILNEIGTCLFSFRVMFWEGKNIYSSF